MADLRTSVTELITGLGMLEYETLDSALAARPAQMVSVAPEQWSQLEGAYQGGALRNEFHAAFENGRAFLYASDGLRGRHPKVIEWKGAQINPGDEALPVDLRVDHVYLISCKYLSKILHNAAPTRVFDHSLRTTATSRSLDWFSETAPLEYQALYEETVNTCGALGLPAKVTELTPRERSLLRASYPRQWPGAVENRYSELCCVIARESASRWSRHLVTPSEREKCLWRLLRFGPAPYFVLGSSKSDVLRFRIATPWDWRQLFDLREFVVEPKAGGQPMVSWRAWVRNRHTNGIVEVDGHVEIRWSHGRFGGMPEAKVYLDTPHDRIPGYFRLT